MILVVVDRFTKYGHFIPLPHPYTVHTMAQAFIDNVFKLHGPPISIVTDRDRIFTSNMWQGIFKAMKVKLRLSTAYHPQSDGHTERVNQCLENFLRCMVFQEPKKWCSWLPLAEWWYNTTYHITTKFTPFQALYNYPSPMISEVAIPGPIDSEAKDFLTKKTGHTIQTKGQSGSGTRQNEKYADQKRLER